MGSKIIPRHIVKSLHRKTKAKVRTGHFTTIQDYLPLIDSFTYKDFQTYDKYRRAWGKSGQAKHIMVEKMILGEITGPALELAKLRESNLLMHQKVKQCLQYRWTDLKKYKKEQINKKIENNPDIFWEKMASKIINQRNWAKSDKKVNQYWSDDKGFIRLVTFLKDLYHKQEGKCAITGLPMTFTVGNNDLNKCSPDRINSTRGYFPDNVHLTVWWVNQMKMDIPLSEFYEKINIIYNYHNKEK